MLLAHSVQSRHRSHLLQGDDDGVTLMGKRHGSRSTTQHSKALVDYLSLMWIRGHGGLSGGEMKAYFLAERTSSGS